MDVLRNRSYLFGIPLVAMAVLWAEIYIFKQDDNTRMKLIKFQLVFLLEVIMSCLTALVMKFSQKIPALTGPIQGRGVWKYFKKILRYSYFLLFVILCAMAQMSWLTTLVPLPSEPSLFTYLCWCAFGVVGQYLVMALFLMLLRTLVGICSKLVSLSSVSFSCANRGVSFDNGRAIFSFIYAFVISALCIHGGLQLPKIKEVHIQMGDKSPPSLAGLVIAQLSDIHLGPTSGLSRLEKIVQLTNSIDADITVVNGDLMDGRVEDLGDAVKLLGQLSSKQGVFFTTGNHEYISGGVDDLLEFLRKHGVRPLHNSNTKIFGRNGKDFLYLVGTDDIFADSVHYKDHGFKLEKAVNGTDSDHVRILLAHQPKAARKALSSDHHFDLILSGHTHGGQYFPYNFLIWVGNPFFRGLYKNLGPDGKSQVYVTEGSVFWGSPFRFASTMEISKLILTK